jgi:anti-sigma regulatory factor (Ser/Thr protein kinase)
VNVRHSLLIYDDDETIVQTMAPFLDEALSQGEPAVAVLERSKLDLLADVLGAEGETLSYLDRDLFYTRPEDALARYDLMLRQLERDGASDVRVFAELPRCEPGAELDSWVSYEAIVNHALEHHPGWIVCGYDRREMPESLVDGGRETHQEVLTDHWERNRDYRPPESVVRSRTPDPVRLNALHPVPVTGSPRMFRERLGAELSVAGMPESDAADLMVAAGEVLANAREHGGEQVTIHVGQVGGQFVCEVSDGGAGLDDPLAGFVPPRAGTGDGAGLWVARQLTHRLEFVPTPGRFTVRLWASPAT